ncbi:MAG: hypothetical protein H9535_07485 [Ignavibacteria bacterium]|nr:hypothetical protein [Ignavibacteria bacterium]
MTKDIANIGAEKQWVMVFISNTLFEKNTNAIKENALFNIWSGVLWERLPDKNAPLFKPGQPTVSCLGAYKQSYSHPRHCS